MQQEKRSSDQARRSLYLITATFATAWGAYQAYSLRWLGDDIFITFRYIANWFDGNGLVYNAGEYVEGYTHFFWLLLLAAGRVVGIGVESSALVFGILAYVATIVVCVLISYRQRGNQWGIPLAAVATALNLDSAIWATGGLETSLFTLLITLTVFVGISTRLEIRKQLLLIGTLLALITLTRPDGALFIVAANLVLVVFVLRCWSDRSLTSLLRSVALLNAPIVVILVPWILWKLRYYGAILPLTYYAKSGGESYFEQGFFYIKLFLDAHLSLWLFVPAILVLIVLLFKSHPTDEDSDRRGQQMWMIAAGCGALGYLVLHVARVGGDFMFARFIVPVMPLVYLTIEEAIRSIGGKRGWVRAVIMVAFIAAIPFENIRREDVLFETSSRGEKHPRWRIDATGNDALGDDRGIVDERWYYTRPLARSVDGRSLSTVETYQMMGETYRKLFDSIPVSICEPGGQNIIAYYSHVPVCIDYYGLTNKDIALQPLSVRGRIGHEKRASDAYLASKGVTFKLDRMASPTPDTTNAEFSAAFFYCPEANMWQRVEIMDYKRETMTALRQRFKTLKNPSYIADYDTLVTALANEFMEQLEPEFLELSYTNLKRSYFSNYPDSAVQNRIEACIARKRSQR